MVTRLSQVLVQLQQAGGGLSDGQLLGRFVATRDEASFAALVRRHGGMVLAVCRRVLGDFHDAEDAFQATFLVLARKAPSLVVGQSLGCWLYRVAYNTALRASAAIGRRRAMEKQVEDVPHPESAPPEVQDWLPLLDRELSRLPEKYRSAIVLCDLEGKTRRDAAGLLRIPEGTLSSRLAAGRQMLAKRLAGCGVTLSGGALAVAMAQGSASAQVPAVLVSGTARAAVLVAAGQLTAVSTTAVVLMKGVMKTMLLKKLRWVVGTMAVLAALGFVSLGYQTANGPGAVQAAPPDKPRSELEALRKENELLKLNLQVVLEKVQAQEAELHTLRNKPPVGGGLMGGMGGGMMGSMGLGGGSSTGTNNLGNFNSSSSGFAGNKFGNPLAPGQLGTSSGFTGGSGSNFTRPQQPNSTGSTPPKSQADPVKDAEAALKQLREARDPEAKRRATEALEKAVEKLKQQGKSKQE